MWAFRDRDLHGRPDGASHRLHDRRHQVFVDVPSQEREGVRGRAT
jgi:hypothetical protein